MKKKLTLVSEILFYGAVWGFLEATLGYLLHTLPTLISGSIMFPIGAFIILRMYLKNQSKSAAVLVGVIAAAIKAFDFFLPMPIQGPIKILNPMLCIVLETVLVVAVIPLLSKNTTITNLVMLPVASTAWRIIFVLMMFLIQGTVPKQIQTMDEALSFFVYNNIFSGILATGLYYLNRLLIGKWSFKWTKQPIFASIMFAIAVTATLIFA